MEDEIYQEEYTREQARMAARQDALPKQKKKNRALQYAAPAMIIILYAYSVFTLGGSSGISLGIFLEPDFLLAVLILTGLFLWARFN